MGWRTQPQHEEGQRSCKLRWRLCVKAIGKGDRLYKVLHWCAAVMALKRERLQRIATDRQTNVTFAAAAKRVRAAWQQALEGTAHAVQPMTLRA